MAERRAWLGLGLGLAGARAAANLLVCMITQRVLGWQSDDDDDYYYYYYYFMGGESRLLSQREAQGREHH